jgi:hypothetical protein
MLIEYVASKSRREVSESIGATLIARRIARPVYQVAALSADDAHEIESVRYGDAEVAGAVEISPRTGKPKRKYKRRDLSAED